MIKKALCGPCDVIDSMNEALSFENYIVFRLDKLSPDNKLHIFVVILTNRCKML